MLAVLRFYRLPHRYVTGEARQGLMASGIAPPRPQLAPTFYFKDEPMVDSTPIIARLETEGVGARSLVPPSGAMAFLSRLIEDFGDEWVTKMMYHYRWDLDTDQEKASQFLMLSSNPSLPPDVLQERSQRIRERQTGRMDFVGSNAVTKPVIEADFRRLVELIDRHLAESGQAFLFGERPSVADYGLFGQLSQLHRVENTSRRVMESISMRVMVSNSSLSLCLSVSVSLSLLLRCT
jgi:glutathione S-transferase